MAPRVIGGHRSEIHRSGKHEDTTPMHSCANQHRCRFGSETIFKQNIRFEPLLRPCTAEWIPRNASLGPYNLRGHKGPNYHNKSMSGYFLKRHLPEIITNFWASQLWATQLWAPQLCDQQGLMHFC